VFLFPPLTLNGSLEHKDKQGSSNGNHLDHQRSDECTLSLLPVSRSETVPEVGGKRDQYAKFIHRLVVVKQRGLQNLLRM
jgi:hypothetical protein